jgi:hypothetical protein
MLTLAQLYEAFGLLRICLWLALGMVGSFILMTLIVVLSVVGERRRERRAVNSGIRCARCGYNLRALRRGSPCPECGAVRHDF